MVKIVTIGLSEKFFEIWFLAALMKIVLKRYSTCNGTCINLHCIMSSPFVEAIMGRQALNSLLLGVRPFWSQDSCQKYDITSRYFYPIKWFLVILLSNQCYCFWWRQKARVREVLRDKFAIFSVTKCWTLDLCCSRVKKLNLF